MAGLNHNRWPGWIGIRTKSLDFDIHAKDPTLLGGAKQHLEEVNRILAQPGFQSIDLEFDKKRGKRKINPEWYQIAGAQSIRQVAKSVGRLAEYTFFYSKGSRITHSASYKDQVRFVNDEVHFKPIRHLDGMS